MPNVGCAGGVMVTGCGRGGVALFVTPEGCVTLAAAQLAASAWLSPMSVSSLYILENSELNELGIALVAEGINPRLLLVSANPCWLFWLGAGVEYIPGAGVVVVGPKDTLRLTKGDLSLLGTCGVYPDAVLVVNVTAAGSFSEPRSAIGPA